MKAEILIVDDDREIRELLAAGLHRSGYTACTALDAHQALERARQADLDVVVTDVAMEGMDGLELCRRLADARPDVPVIVLTAHDDVETAIGAIRAGAYDFITKPLSVDAFVVAVERAVAHRQLEVEIRRLREAGHEAPGIENILGRSDAIRGVIDLIHRVAPSEATVLVTGESGTGKELVARAVHDLSARRQAPFVAVNCAAMPQALLESELFGHVRGAFTDAKQARTGLFLQAGAGTIFLDEIGELPAEMQVKLLRVLQERVIRPVGGDEETPVKARVVAATNRDLETDVEEGRFRADLYYRINVVQIDVPPLRARRGDVQALAHHFLAGHAARGGKSITGISTAAARKLIDYDWPGNIRELENCMERAVALARLSEITVEDLPDPVREHQSTRLVIGGDDPEQMLTLAEMERRYVRRVLSSVGGNKSRAARILGIDRRSLYRRLADGEGGGEG